jgi:hypothetical protein
MPLAGPGNPTRPVDTPSPDREHWTCGNYVYSRLRAMDMFQCPAGEVWTCPSLARGTLPTPAKVAGHAPS